jgi:hypothetical protein
MSESIAELRKRVKELRGAIVGSVSSAGVEELKKEIAYHESAAKSAERDKKRMEALAKAREAKIAKGKSKKEAEAKPVEKKEKVAEAKPVAVKKEKVAEAKPKKVKVAPAPVAEEVVLSKNIRAKKVKNAEDDE